jgi:hypothetical protein
MVTLYRAHDSFVSDHFLVDGNVSIGRGEMTQGRRRCAADKFVRKGTAIILFVCDNILYLHNRNFHDVRIYDGQDIRGHHVQALETVALCSHDRVRMCPDDTADGVEKTDLHFAHRVLSNVSSFDIEHAL